MSEQQQPAADDPQPAKKTKFVEIPGIRTKFRSGDGFLTATLHVEGVGDREVARIALDMLDRSGSEIHHTFVDVISKAVNGYIERRTGESGIVSKRKKAKD